MARAFNIGARVSSFELPALTKQQIAVLMSDLDMDARSIVITAITELWQREIGKPERDIYAELDAIKVRIGL